MHFDYGYVGWKLSSQLLMVGILESLALNLVMLGLVFVFFKKLMKYLVLIAIN